MPAMITKIDKDTSNSASVNPALQRADADAVDSNRFGSLKRFRIEQEFDASLVP